MRTPVASLTYAPCATVDRRLGNMYMGRGGPLDAPWKVATITRLSHCVAWRNCINYAVRKATQARERSSSRVYTHDACCYRPRHYASPQEAEARQGALRARAPHLDLQ